MMCEERTRALFTFVELLRVEQMVKDLWAFFGSKLKFRGKDEKFAKTFTKFRFFFRLNNFYV